MLAVPTSIVAAVAPGAVASFAAGERVRVLAQSGIQPLFNAFQGWVSEVPGQVIHRMRLAVGVTAACGALGGAVFALALPRLDGLLFAGEVSVGHGVSGFFGVALALYALTSAINLTVLAPAGLTRTILRSTATAGLVVVVGAAVLSHPFGAVGGAASVAAAQAAALAVQLPAWRRVLRATAGGSPVRASPLGRGTVG
jgi:O-antigen/teichoic acid export membrane protein